MSLTDESLEWRSIQDVLSTIYVNTVRSTVGTEGVMAFTDVACIKNPGGPAGWSVILLASNNVTDVLARSDSPCIESYGHIPKATTTTNNPSEITASPVDL